MIGSVNLYSGFSNIKPNTDENSLNLSSRNLAKNTSQSSDQINLSHTNESKFNKDDEPLKFTFSLTGRAANGKISIWGNQPRRDKRA